MNKIRKGDKVVVRTGKDKGKQGTVLNIDGDRVFVEGVNIVKRHTKPNPQKNQTGGIVEKEASIHVSNLGLANPASGKPERVGFRTLQDGRKVRFLKKSNEVVDMK
jgi:large subunit ribosomal protein L24